MGNFCSNCGKELDDNAKFCDNCGNSIVEQISQKKKSEKIFFIGAILSFVLSAVCLGISIYHDVTYIGGATVSIMESYGDSRGLYQHYFIENLMTALNWIGIILLAVSIIFAIVGFMKKLKNKNMKKFFCYFLSLIITLSISGCQIDNKANTNTDKDFLCVKEQDYGLVFNLTVNQFIDNYNKNLEELSDYGSINPNDSFQMNDGTGRFNSITSESFAYRESICSSTIVILKDKKNNYITSVYIMCPSDMGTDMSDIYNEAWFIYGNIIKTINPEITNDNVDEIVNDMYNSKTKTAYKKGMVFYATTSSNGIILGVDAVKESEYKKIINN